MKADIPSNFITMPQADVENWTSQRTQSKQRSWPGAIPRPKVLRTDQVWLQLDCDRPAAPWLEYPAGSWASRSVTRPPHRGMSPHPLDNSLEVMRIEKPRRWHSQEWNADIAWYSFVYRWDDCSERIFMQEARGSRGARGTC